MIKKIAIATGALSLLLISILGIHIYMVTRPQPIDPKAIVMARIDMREDIDQNDANKITAWLDAQPGVNHTYVNPKTEVVVFTFFPAQVSANEIVKNFKTTFHYQKAERFMPSTAQLSGGCPAGYGSENSLTSKLENFFK